MTKRIIQISDIGADHSAFSRLQYSSEFSVIHAHWLELEDRDETFHSYCQRMAQTYHINKDDILIGFSFGGLIAQELAKTIGHKHVVLISSFRNKNDLQPLMSFGLKWKLNRLLPSFRVPYISNFTAHFLNSKQKEGRKVIDEMLRKSDFSLLNWCIKQIGQIDLSETFSSNYLCFTGQKDKLVKDWNSSNHISVANGEHFMVFDQADIINEHLNKYLLQLD